MSHERNEEPLSVDEPTISPSLTRLSPRNPLDHLRLLWWTLVMPQQLKRYQEEFGEAAVKQRGKWLVSSLIWLPILYAILGLGLETLPRFAEAFPPTTYLWISGFLFIAWLLTGIFGDRDHHILIGLTAMLLLGILGILGIFFTVLPLGVVLVLAISVGVVGILALVLTLPLSVGVVLMLSSALVTEVGTSEVFLLRKGSILVSSIITTFLAIALPLLAVRQVNVVKESIKTGHSSSVGRGVFGLLVATHAFLVWFSFLGGWRVFGQ